MTWAQRLKRVLTSTLKPVSNAVVRGYSEHRQIGKKADLHSEYCPAGVRHMDVSNENPLII